MTNAHALLDGTEAAFRQVHASERSFAWIFKKVHIYWGQRSVDAITNLNRFPKKHSPRSTFTEELRTQVDFEVDRQPPADSPRGDHLITMVLKGNEKKEFREK